MVTTAYLVTDESAEADQQVEQSLITGIEQSTGLQYIPDASNVSSGTFAISGSQKVGATIADDFQLIGREGQLRVDFRHRLDDTHVALRKVPEAWITIALIKTLLRLATTDNAMNVSGKREAHSLA